MQWYHVQLHLYCLSTEMLFIKYYVRYTLRYAMGGTHSFVKKAPGLPLNVTRAAALKILETGITMQVISREKLDDFEAVKAHVRNTVQTYGNEVDARDWEDFFRANIPTFGSSGGEKMNTWLHRLYNHPGGGGEARQKSYANQAPKVPLSNYVDQLTYKGK